MKNVSVKEVSETILISTKILIGVEPLWNWDGMPHVLIVLT